MTVRFSRVGREKKSWTAEVPDLDDETLIREIRRSNALMSRTIDVIWNDQGTGGLVMVGIFRPVGYFRVEKKP